ncbi:hypothetical protein BXZ70DRAFT_918600 [Cristinia sonorae]|uniref:C2 domain-containing protein n=1 Tax=Cristinia sonorae TaxID=1940300 RepID=A0A8K0UW68_9AGAR|nr:hypothetical protein BXZ70DRAFT_918600 [Cristinia sonorae]
MSSTPREVGTLIAVILKARNLPNKRHIGKQDPYCTISFNGDKRRTKAIKRGGQHPEWDEEIRFTLFEDTAVDPTLLNDDGTPPPPPPKKDERGSVKIKGGKSMALACYAEDLREPDLIGETMVDLTEVLTKGETDEWFTLMNKDKYSGEVYLELTFWSNEPAPAKKLTPKPKPQKQYGGPGSFVPSGESPTHFGDGSYQQSSSRMSSFSSKSDSRDTIPSSLRASSSLAKVDLYVPPYESRNHRQSGSMDSTTTDFSEFGVGSRRRTSMPPSQSYLPRPSSSVGFSEHSPMQPRPSYGYDHGSYSDGGSSYGYDRPMTPTVPYHEGSLSSSEIVPYQAPYESTLAPRPPMRHPRYSIPASSSGFMPIPTPTPAPSGFQPTSSFHNIQSQATGTSLIPPSSSTPAPFGFAPTPTPAPMGYGPPPSRLPVPTSSFPQSSFPVSMMPSSSYPSIPPSHSSQSSLSFPSYGGSGFAPHQVPQQPPAQLPPPASNATQPLVPPPPPLTTPQQSYSASYDQGQAIPPSASPSYIQTHTSPQTIHDSPSPVLGQQSGGRPLPTSAGPAGNHARRQSSLPVPPSTSVGGGFSPTGMTSFGYPTSSHGTQGLPPPPTHNNGLPAPPSPNPSNGLPTPPAPTQGIPPSSVNQPPAQPGYSNSLPPPPPKANVSFNSQTLPGPPPPLPFNSTRLPSSSFPPPPPPSQGTYQQQPVAPGKQSFIPPPPPPQSSSRRPSLPPPPMPYQQQSGFQSLPPPPPPPTMLAQRGQQEVAIAFPSANLSQVSYPGPLPRPPSQHLPPSSSYGYPVQGGSWQ